MKKNDWYKKALHRNVIDMHITSFKEEFLSEFDSDKYVEMLKLAKVESSVIYAHSHVGLTNFPTKYGYMHPNLKGRDIFKEVIEKSKKADIKVVAYFSLIFDLWAYNNNPDWQMRTSTDKHWDDNIRFGVCCPNSEGYRKYLKNIVTELCENYDFDGIRFDMTFWPGYCYCKSCQERFKKEYDMEIPKTVNWFEKTWVSFQRARERWLAEFAGYITETVKAAKPEVSVEHQSSTFNANSGFGVSVDLCQHSEFLQGDFYGGYVQGSMACKLFYNLSPNLPFGFETSCNETLRDHTTLKKENMLEAKTYMSIANGGAFVFIDAIDPIGTHNKYVYETFNKIFTRTQKYEKYIGGKLIENVAIYLSTESKCSFSDNGKDVSELHNTPNSEHIDALMGATRAMIKNHIPFGIITRKNLNTIDKYPMIILPNVLMLSKQEVLAFREYVKNGGRIYASKYTSLVDTDGVLNDNFMLSDVFGITFEGVLDDKITFIAPYDQENKVLPEHVTQKYPVHIDDQQMLVKSDTAKVIWKLGKAYTTPYEKWPFASIHSDPPGEITDYPSLVVNDYGKGKSYYCSAILENQKYHDKIFADLIKEILGGQCILDGGIPRQVEVIMFDQESRYLVNLLSFQEEMPNLPIPEFTIKLKTNGKKVKKISYDYTETNIEFSQLDGYVTFVIKQFNTFAMYLVHFE